MIVSRRSLLTGLTSLLCAPAIVRASSLMPVKMWTPTALLDWARFGTEDTVLTLHGMRKGMPVCMVMTVPADAYPGTHYAPLDIITSSCVVRGSSSSYSDYISLRIDRDAYVAWSDGHIRVVAA